HRTIGKSPGRSRPGTETRGRRGLPIGGSGVQQARRPADLRAGLRQDRRAVPRHLRVVPRGPVARVRHVLRQVFEPVAGRRKRGRHAQAAARRRQAAAVRGDSPLFGASRQFRHRRAERLVCHRLHSGPSNAAAQRVGPRRDHEEVKPSPKGRGVAEGLDQVTLRIANGAGFLGDNLDAPRRLVESASLDYLTLEYLAELTLSILARLREKNPAAGYAEDFMTVLASLLPALTAQPSLKIVTNAGGMNPCACAQAAARILAG